VVEVESELRAARREAVRQETPLAR
jgi:hypothetical protein